MSDDPCLYSIKNLTKYPHHKFSHNLSINSAQRQCFYILQVISGFILHSNYFKLSPFSSSTLSKRP